MTAAAEEGEPGMPMVGFMTPLAGLGGRKADVGFTGWQATAFDFLPCVTLSVRFDG